MGYKTEKKIPSIILSVFIVLLILVGTIVPAYAAPTQDMMVTDSGEMLSDREEQEVSEMLYSINRQTGIEYLVYTIKSLNGEDIETCANRLFRTAGLWDKEKDNGLLLLISYDDRKFRLVVLHGGKATVLSKREIGADTINFYNYFARYCLSPEEPLLKLLNCADDEAIEIISGQPLVKQFCWDSSSSCTDALTKRNQATAKEALTYTRNLTQQAFSELDAVFSEFHDTKGPDGSKVVFMPKQVITTFALLNNKIVQVYSVKDLCQMMLWKSAVKRHKRTETKHKRT